MATVSPLILASGTSAAFSAGLHPTMRRNANPRVSATWGRFMGRSRPFLGTHWDREPEQKANIEHPTSKPFQAGNQHRTRSWGKRIGTNESPRNTRNTRKIGGFMESRLPFLSIHWDHEPCGSFESGGASSSGSGASP